MTQDAVLELSNVNLSFGSRNLFRRNLFHVLKDISVSIHQGETLGIVGRNGCGKSTLLRLIAGVYSPGEGSVINRAKRVSLLSLSLGFDPFLSGRDNALLCGMLMGIPRDEVLAQVDDIIEFAELNDFADQPIRTYSAGMRARLGFSVATYSSADLLLIDEVLGVGDKNFQRKSFSIMRQKMESGQSAVFVSHSQNQVQDLCDRVLWLDQGKTMALGQTNEVLEAYNEFMQKLEDRQT